MHPDLYNFHTRSLATTSATLGSSNSSALSLTEPSASLGNHQSCHYSNSWNDGCPLATAVSSLLQNKPWEPPTALTIQHGANGTTPLLCQRGVNTITRSPLLANSPVQYIVLILFSLVLMITFQLLLFYPLSSRVCQVLVICCILWPFVR